MSESKRKDCASFEISFNLPPEVIKEYFDGLAKVETAKHGPPMPVPKSSGLDLMSLLSLSSALLPLVTPYLTKLISKDVASPQPIRRPMPMPSSRVTRDQFEQEVRDRVTEEHGPLSGDENKILSMMLSQEVDKVVPVLVEQGIAVEKNKDATVVADKDPEVEDKEKEEKKEEVVGEAISKTTNFMEGNGFAEMMKMMMPMVKELGSAFGPPPKTTVSTPTPVKEKESDSDSEEELVVEEKARPIPFDE